MQSATHYSILCKLFFLSIFTLISFVLGGLDFTIFYYWLLLNMDSRGVGFAFLLLWRLIIYLAGQDCSWEDAYLCAGCIETCNI